LFYINSFTTAEVEGLILCEHFQPFNESHIFTNFGAFWKGLGHD
jgi:hypothetical protein